MVLTSCTCLFLYFWAGPVSADETLQIARDFPSGLKDRQHFWEIIPEIISSPRSCLCVMRRKSYFLCYHWQRRWNHCALEGKRPMTCGPKSNPYSQNSLCSTWGHRYLPKSLDISKGKRGRRARWETQQYSNIMPGSISSRKSALFPSPPGDIVGNRQSSPPESRQLQLEAWARISSPRCAQHWGAFRTRALARPLPVRVEGHPRCLC